MVGFRFLTKHVLVAYNFIIACEVGDTLLWGLLLGDLGDAVSVATVKDAVPWVLSNGVAGRWDLVLGWELVTSHWAVGWTVWTIFFTAKNLSLLLWHKRCTWINSFLFVLLCLIYNILSLLHFGCFYGASVLALNILQPLLGLSPFNSTVSSTKCSTGIVGYGWRWSLNCNSWCFWLVVIWNHDTVVLFVLEDLHRALTFPIDLRTGRLWQWVKIWVRVWVSLRRLRHYIIKLFHQDVISSRNFVDLGWFLRLVHFRNRFIFAIRSLGVLKVLGWLSSLVLLVGEVDVWVIFQSTKKFITCNLILMDRFLFSSSVFWTWNWIYRVIYISILLHEYVYRISSRNRFLVILLHFLLLLSEHTMRRC